SRPKCGFLEAGGIMGVQAIRAYPETANRAGNPCLWDRTANGQSGLLHPVRPSYLLALQDPRPHSRRRDPQLPDVLGSLPEVEAQVTKGRVRPGPCPLSVSKKQGEG